MSESDKVGEYKLVRADILEWLSGAATHPVTGAWFDRPQGAGAFWWRKDLREATKDAPLSAAQLIASLCRFPNCDCNTDWPCGAASAESRISSIPRDVLEKAIQFKGRADDAGFLARAIIALESTQSSERRTYGVGELQTDDYAAALLQAARELLDGSVRMRVFSFDADGLPARLAKRIDDHLKAPRSATTPSNALTRDQFDDILRKIGSRMGGHTIDARYGKAFGLFMTLLALVKPEECGIHVRAEEKT